MGIDQITFPELARLDEWFGDLPSVEDNPVDIGVSPHEGANFCIARLSGSPMLLE